MLIGKSSMGLQVQEVRGDNYFAGQGAIVMAVMLIPMLLVRRDLNRPLLASMVTRTSGIGTSELLQSTYAK